MYSYIKGIVTYIFKDHVVLENHGIGYIVYVANPYRFKKDEETTIYIYMQVKEDSQLLFGFASFEERELFLKLITVKGIGPKTALNALATLEVNHIVEAIENSDVNVLKKIPGIGLKAASQIVLDLQGKLVTTPQESSNPDKDEASEVLLALGYKASEVNRVMKKIDDETLDTNGYVK